MNPKPDLKPNRAPNLDRRRALCAAAFGGLLPAWARAAQGDAAAAPRVALVIGNGAYPHAPLPNANNDARSMAEALGNLGFSVVQLRDGTRQQMDAAIAQARTLLEGRNGIGLLYYAGHGLQIDWRNFMLPVDAMPTRASEVPRLGVDTQTVIEAFRSAGNRINILVLDACRDNPFEGLALHKGLAPMDAPPGTYMAYATAPGNVAEDGSAADGNGLYTRFLIREIQRPEARIEDVFKRVRAQVRQASQGRQVPWDSSSLEDDFVFATGQQVADAGRRQREAAFDAQKAAWDRIKDSTRPADFYEFLRQHPTGGMAELAMARLERLERSGIQPQADQRGEVQNPVATRFRLGDRYALVIRDGLTGLERRRLQVRVTQVGQDRADYVGLRSDGIPSASTLAGAVISDGLGSYDPPYTLIPGGDFQLGKRWSGRSLRTGPGGSRGWMEYTGRIVARERIQVPAGGFDTWRVEMTVMLDTGESQRRTLWMQPDWGIPLSLRIESRTAGGGADVLVRELLSRERGA